MVFSSLQRFGMIGEALSGSSVRSRSSWPILRKNALCASTPCASAIRAAPTFLKRSEAEARALAKKVIKSETSEKMRYLMRLNAEIGTARQADVKGYYIGGKTGTSEKVVNGRYSKKQVLNSFTAIVPADNPQFQVLVMLDEPKALPETHGFITSGWNAVPTGGKVIARIAPLLGIEPRFDLPPSERLILAASKTTQ